MKIKYIIFIILTLCQCSFVDPNYNLKILSKWDNRIQKFIYEIEQSESNYLIYSHFGKQRITYIFYNKSQSDTCIFMRFKNYEEKYRCGINGFTNARKSINDLILSEKFADTIKIDSDSTNSNSFSEIIFCYDNHRRYYFINDNINRNDKNISRIVKLFNEIKIFIFDSRL